MAAGAAAVGEGGDACAGAWATGLLGALTGEDVDVALSIIALAGSAGGVGALDGAPDWAL